MDREPKISEIEKLIKHFRETEREHELLEVLAKHGIQKENPLEVVEEGTNEFHPEGIAYNKIAEKEGLIRKTNRVIVTIYNAFKTKWYLRYGAYYILIFVAIFALLNAPVLVSQFFFKPKEASNLITINELKETPMEDSAPIAAGEVVPSGSQLVIPKINVKAPIIYVPTQNEQSIQASLPNGVVHYNGTAKPGEVGNTFITGHSSNFWWIKGKYNYVFLNLNKLKAGDQATIYRDGKKYIYQVRSTKVVAPTDTSVLAPTDTPVLTLMTCTPPGTNWKRLIVTMDQVAPKYTKPQMVTRQIKANQTLPGDSNSIGAIFLKIKDFFIGLF